MVGCDLAGVNAYFVRADLTGDHFLGPFDAETHFEPFRPFLCRPQSYPVSYGAFFGG